MIEQSVYLKRNGRYTVTERLDVQSRYQMYERSSTGFPSASIQRRYRQKSNQTGFQDEQPVILPPRIQGFLVYAANLGFSTWCWYGNGAIKAFSKTRSMDRINVERA